jgi:hypothetical protein
MKMRRLNGFSTLEDLISCAMGQSCWIRSKMRSSLAKKEEKSLSWTDQSIVSQYNMLLANRMAGDLGLHKKKSCEWTNVNSASESNRSSCSSMEILHLFRRPPDFNWSFSFLIFRLLDLRKPTSDNYVLPPTPCNLWLSNPSLAVRWRWGEDDEEVEYERKGHSSQEYRGKKDEWQD